MHCSEVGTNPHGAAVTKGHAAATGAVLRPPGCARPVLGSATRCGRVSGSGGISVPPRWDRTPEDERPVGETGLPNHPKAPHPIEPSSTRTRRDGFSLQPRSDPPRTAAAPFSLLFPNPFCHPVPPLHPTSNHGVGGERGASLNPFSPSNPHTPHRSPLNLSPSPRAARPQARPTSTSALRARPDCARMRPVTVLS